MFGIGAQSSRRIAAVSVCIVTALAAGAAREIPALAAPSPVTLPGNTPPVVAQAKDLGAADPTQQVDVSVWLKLRNETGLARQLSGLYSPRSTTYHQWLDQAQFDASYAPTAGQVTAVSNFLRGQGLQVGAVAENNLSIDASGSLDVVEKAFHVQVDNYSYGGRTYRSNVADPSINDTATASLIEAVTGLSDFDQVDAAPQAWGSSEPAPLEAQPGDVFHETCGDLTTTKTFPYADATSATVQGLFPCDGYNAAQLQKAYGIDRVIAGGLDGRGQTVVIVDAFGSPTILNDANRFSAVNGLPPLDSSNFSVVAAPRPQDRPAKDPLEHVLWAGETTLDVEAVHALAPGAKIVLVASAENRGNALLQALNVAIVRRLGSVITNSWGAPGILYSANAIAQEERIFMEAAAEGIDVNFGSGDAGDGSTWARPNGTVLTLPKNVDYPGSSPWVTSVGGTSLFLNADGSYNLETGWGETLARRASCLQATSPGPDGLQDCTLWDPSSAQDVGFIAGSGGGLSDRLSAQPWQAAAIGGATAIGFGAVGTHRAVPDISMVGDGKTGMSAYWTFPYTGQLAQFTFGGTSLSCPLFAGVLALVDQAREAAGKPATGLVTPLLYGLPAGAVHDTLPTQPVNPVPGQPGQYLLHYTGTVTGNLYDATMDADSSLNTSLGWDDVTGLGTPRGAAFINALSAP